MTEGATIPSRTLGRFGATLAAAGYTERGLARLLGVDALPTPIGQAQQEIFRRRLISGDGGELVTLALCLLLGEPASRHTFAQALPGVDINELKEVGLLLSGNGDEDTVRAGFAITPWKGLLLAHDAYVSKKVTMEHVTGVTAATKTLAGLTVRREALSSLDLGSGCGALALLLAYHSGRVTATDVNRRALFLTELNAGLNSLPSVHTRLGSLFEPVAGERFDVIACNPPYVISPENDLIFRDSGLPGDTICR
ncbi:MAG: methyltransferase, partial [Trueperaceae bacterium]